VQRVNGRPESVLGLQKAAPGGGTRLRSLNGQNERCGGARSASGRLLAAGRRKEQAGRGAQHAGQEKEGEVDKLLLLLLVCWRCSRLLWQQPSTWLTTEGGWILPPGVGVSVYRNDVVRPRQRKHRPC
jgi:hypothetical protein